MMMVTDGGGCDDDSDTDDGRCDDDSDTDGGGCDEISKIVISKI